MNTTKIDFRKASETEADTIWSILQQAIERRKQDGSQQWQDGYPNPQTVQSDIEKGLGFVLTENDTVVACCALILNYEPAYDTIEGEWLTTSDFFVVHRVAVSNEVAGKGYATEIFAQLEKFAKDNKVYSIKADTNFDNPVMLHILKKRGYVYCGEVYFRGAPRKAYEKLLK